MSAPETVFTVLLGSAPKDVMNKEVKGLQLQGQLGRQRRS
jgi:hypothetical protein